MSDLAKRLRSGVMSDELLAEAANEIERMEGLLFITKDGVAVGPDSGPFWAFDDYGKIVPRHFKDSLSSWVYGNCTPSGVHVWECYSTRDAIEESIREANRKYKAEADHEQLLETEEIKP